MSELSEVQRHALASACPLPPVWPGLASWQGPKKTKRNLLMQNNPPIDPRVRIGHVHLRVANLERSLGFYCGLLGFQLMQRYGPGAAFVSAGGYHHHIGLNTWESLT